MPTITEALHAAVALHQQNRLQEAADLYQRILQADSSVADAWHLLGVLLHQVGQHDEAVRLIGEAIARDPACAAYHDNLGSALRALGQATRAANSHRRGIALDPGASKPLGNLGNALLDAQQADGAIAALRRACRLSPEQESLLLRLADALQSHGRAGEAESLYEQFCARGPERPELRYRLGISKLAASGLTESTLGTAGQSVDRVRMRDAVACFDKAGRGGHADALRNLFGTTILALQNGVLDDATLGAVARTARHRLMVEPRDTGALSVVCYDLYRRKRLDLAERFFRKFARHIAPEAAAGDFEVLLWSLVRVSPRFFAELDGHRSRVFDTAAHRTLVPREDDGRPVVLVGCDEVYWQRFGADFLASWRAHAGSCALHLHIINPSEATVGVLVQLGRSPGLSCSCEHIDVAPLPEPVRKTYYASARFAVAGSLLRDGRSPVVQVDVDAAFLRDPAPAMAEWPDWDVAVMEDRRGRGPTRDLLAGFLAFNATEAGRAFLDRVVAYIGWHFDRGQVYWTLDQAAPYCVHDRMARAGSPPRIVRHDFEAFPYLHFLAK